MRLSLVRLNYRGSTSIDSTSIDSIDFLDRLPQSYYDIPRSRDIIVKFLREKSMEACPVANRRFCYGVQLQ